MLWTGPKMEGTISKPAFNLIYGRNPPYPFFRYFFLPVIEGGIPPYLAVTVHSKLIAGIRCRISSRRRHFAYGKCSWSCWMICDYSVYIRHSVKYCLAWFLYIPYAQASSLQGLSCIAIQLSDIDTHILVNNLIVAADNVSAVYRKTVNCRIQRIP